MDPERFDRLARLFGRPASRRGALAALAAAVAARGGHGGAAAAAAPGARGAFQRGPCGDGGPKANRCRKHRDCCTGVCQKPKRGKRRTGRCRCRRAGQPCAETRNCCPARQALACVDGTCQPSPCDPPCGECRRCRQGQCEADPTKNGTCCDGGGVCADGTCAACPTGQTCAGGACCTPDCAGKCGGAEDGCGGVCDGDCGAGRLCAGQTCVTGQGTCPTGSDTCGRIATACNGRAGCFCRVATEGDTRCGGGGLAGGGVLGCGECASSADCATLYPNVPGAFCMRSGTGCCNGTAPRGKCMPPCPS